MATDTGVSPAHAAAIEAMKGQLLIVLVERLGGNVEIPVAEIDDTSGKLLMMELDQEKRCFKFVVTKKN